MAGKVISVWLNSKELARFDTAAQKRGMSISTFLKVCADEVITGPDASTQLKELAADLRADIAKSIGRFAEAAALASEQDRANNQAFLNELFEQQVDVVKKAVAVGQGALRARPSSFDDFPPSTQPSPRLTGTQS